MQRISFELYCTLNARACTVRTYTPSLSLPYFDQYNSNSQVQEKVQESHRRRHTKLPRSFELKQPNRPSYYLCCELRLFFPI